ncbi:MAG: GHKL domain-containing protein, partial [Ruminococcus sp.]|nr:GHKL domain-containing protein [Ruminococcus sp.]
DVLSMDIGQNEWVQGTQKQVANMRKLVNELVYLSRMDETDSHLEKSVVDLSKAVQDVAAPFEGMAEFNGKNMILHIEDDIKVSGDEAALRRLISTLCENAVKYAPEDSDIQISLTQSGKSVMLTTENAMKEPLGEEALNHLFDRFYRGDESRSKEENSGFGIGLSIARAITEKHGGTIKAKIVDSIRLQIICLLPKR